MLTRGWVVAEDRKTCIHVIRTQRVNLVSSFVGPEPFDKVQRYDRRIRAHVEVPRPNIVKSYYKYTGGIDKLDMMCAMYKPSVKSRRWYIYLWLHSIMMTVVNAWILYRRHQKELGKRKYLPLRHFQARIASGLAAANKPHRGRPSLQGDKTIKKRKSLQSRPESDVRVDHLDHMPEWMEKKAAMLPLQETKCIFICEVYKNAMFFCASTRTETVSVTFMCK